MDLQAALHTHRQAVDDFLAVSRVIPAEAWTQPRAKGKWSPAEITEHLALAYDFNRGVLQGSEPEMAAPRWLRPLLRVLLLRPVLRRRRFIPGAKSPKMFRPRGAPVTQEVLLARLQASAQGFEK